MTSQTSLVQTATKAVLLLFAATAVTLFFMGKWLIGEVNHLQASRSMQERATLVFQLLENDIANKLHNLQHASNMLKLKDFSEVSRHDVESLSHEFDGVVWAGLATLDGKVRFATGGILEGVDVSARPWFKAGQRGPSVLDKHDALLLASKLPARADPYKFIDIAVPVYSRQEELVGVMALHMDWTWFQGQFPGLLGGEPSVSMISSVITGPDGELRLAKLGHDQTADDLRHMLEEVKQGGLDNGQYLIVTLKAPPQSKLASLGWSIHLIRPMGSINSQTISAVSLSIAGLLLGMLSLSVLMVYLARRLSRTIGHHLNVIEHESIEGVERSERALPRELMPLMLQIRDLLTRLKRKAQLLREQLERTELSFVEINALIHQAPVAIGMFDREMRYVACSEQWCRTYLSNGIDPIGLSHYEVVANIPQEWRDFHARGLQGESIQKSNDLWIDAQGQKFWINWIIQPWKGKDGTGQGVIIMTEDVSEAHRSKAALAESEERFQLAMEGSTDGMYDWMVKEDRVYLSPGWKAMLGYKPEELENSLDTWNRLLHPDDYEAAQVYLSKTVANPQAMTWLMNFRLAHKNGAWVNILSRGKIIRNAQGEAVRVIGTHLDRTEVEKLQLELQQAWVTAQAEAQSNEAKSKFLATVSHEIRNPMNAIAGFARLIADDTESEEIAHYAKLLNQTTDSLKLVLNDILDFAKIDAGKLEIVESTFNLSELIEGLAESTRLQCVEKGISFELTKGLSSHFYTADAGRIRQVIQNLLSNAIKFTEKGAVKLKVLASRVDEERDSILIRVRDTGFGIPADRAHQLFKPFSQLHRDSSVRSGGTGLGLTIVKSLVEAMGGRIECESREGEGSVFCVTLNLQKAQPPAKVVRTEPVAVHTKRILIADDMPTNLHILKAFLRKRGHVVSTVDNGQQALELLQQEPFDYVLLDIDMPDVSGYEVVRAVRSSLGVNQNTPFACITGHAMKDSVDAAQQAGFNQFFSKPVDLDLVLDAVSR